MKLYFNNLNLSLKKYNLSIMDKTNYKLNTILLFDVVEYTKIIIPKIKINKMSFQNKSNNYRIEFFYKIPYHSQR